MVFLVVLLVVAAVLLATRTLNRHGSATRFPLSRSARIQQDEILRHRTGQEARAALADLRASEHTIANSSIPRPLGADFGRPSNGGVEVVSVKPGSPAARVGLLDGIVLTSIGGQPTPDAEAARVALGAQIPGLGVRLTWIRQGEPHEAEVVL